MYISISSIMKTVSACMQIIKERHLKLVKRGDWSKT